MIWNEEQLKEIQRCENRIFHASTKAGLKDAETDMERATQKYVKDTKPKSAPAPVNFIGRSTYSHGGELIGFYLEPIIKIR